MAFGGNGTIPSGGRDIVGEGGGPPSQAGGHVGGANTAGTAGSPALAGEGGIAGDAGVAGEGGIAGEEGVAGEGGVFGTEGGVWQPSAGSGANPDHPQACTGELGLPNPPLLGHGRIGTPADFDGDGRLDIPVATPYGVSLLMQQQSGLFAAARRIIDFGATNSRFVAVADFDGDTRPDIVAANFEGNTVAVGLNSAESFPIWPNWQELNVGVNPVGMVAADLDGDSDLDLAVASYTDGKVSVLFNDGTGKFAAAVSYLDEPGLFDIKALDLDDDGFPELLLAHAGNATIDVLLNHQGVLSPGPRYPANVNAAALELADLNGDDRLDVVVANAGYQPGGYSVLVNQAPGSLSPPVFHEVDTNTRAVALGDLDDDGETDVAVLTPSSLATAFNPGSGDFGRPESYPTAGSTPLSVFAADLNGDGWLDLASSSDAGMAISYNLGDGEFGVEYAVPYAARALAADDFTGDGRVDLAVARTTGLSLLVGRSDGTLQVPDAELSSARTIEIASADFDASGSPDLVVSIVDSEDLLVLMNRGDGVFDDPISIPALSQAWALLTGDYSGDGLPDIVVSSGAGASLIVNEGGGSFAAPVVVGAGGRAAALAGVDLNGDGRLDLVMANPAGGWDIKLRIFLNEGQGGFSQFSFYDSSGSNISAIVPVDSNRDGRMDLAVEDSGLGAVRVLLNHGATTFLDWTWQDYPISGYGRLRTADMNDDGWPDLVQSSERQVRVFLNAGDGTFGWPLTYTAGTMIFDIVPTDLNADGRVDVAVADVHDGNVRVLSNSCR
jgi:hypothetical protein